jgi:hypothetical protein
MDFIKEKIANIVDRYFTATDRGGIEKLNDALDEMISSFGGCADCFGKGYATEYVASQPQSVDMGVVGGATYKEGKRVKINFCHCARGQQLQFLLSQTPQT